MGSPELHFQGSGFWKSLCLKPAGLDLGENRPWGCAVTEVA